MPEFQHLIGLELNKETLFLGCVFLIELEIESAFLVSEKPRSEDENQQQTQPTHDTG